MLVSYLSQYGLFLAKTLTLILGLLFLVGGIISLLHKKQDDDEGVLRITHLNDEMHQHRLQIQEATLDKWAFKAWKKEQKKADKALKAQWKEEHPSPRLFVIRFDGDIRASEVDHLRKTITAVLDVITPHDEILLILDSMGGMVHSYGLAAAELERIRQKNVHFTVAVDKVAASGGYLMAVVANRIISAPFAIIGSIGVIAQIPNFHRFLKKHDIDFEQQTAGEFKRTLTIFGENTEKGREKFQEEINETHTLFKNFITQYRPTIDIAAVATGEHWHGMDALQRSLVDDLKTSDAFITEKLDTHQIYEIAFEMPKPLAKRVLSGLQILITGVIDKCTSHTKIAC